MSAVEVRIEQRRKLAKVVWSIAALRVLPVFLVLFVWEFGPLDVSFFSKPSAVLLRLVEDLVNGRLLMHFSITISEIFWGYLIGVLIGGILGYAAGISRPVAAIIEPYAILFQSIPKVAIAPLMIIWFGIGPLSKVVMAIAMVFFVAFFNILLGVRAVNPDYISLARIMGARPSDVVLRVILPFITPYVIVGLKQAIVFAVIGTMIAEFLASSRGLGYYIAFASGQFDATGVFAGVIVLMALVIIVNGFLNLIERRYMGWYIR